MRKPMWFIIGVVLACLASFSPCPAASASEIEEVETGLGPEIVFETDTTWTIEERMEHYDVPGVSIAVIKDFRVDWAKAYGFADRESQTPVTTGTLFQAASISKPTTGLAVLKCVEDGLLSLDADVNTMLKSWKLPENEFTDSAKVTIAELLSHRAGVTVGGFAGYTASEPIPTLRQILDGEPPANSPPIRVDILPGTQRRYSGGGFCILQQLLIDTLGKPFPEIMRELVLEPIGMSSSTYELPLGEEKAARAATAYPRDAKPAGVRWHLYPEMAAAGLWTTPVDLAGMIIEVQLSIKGRSNRVLGQAMQTRMLTSVGGSRSGLGFGISRIGTGTYFEHSGGNYGFACYAIGHLNDGYGLVVMTNGARGHLLREEIQNSVGRAYGWEGTLPPYKVVEVGHEILDRYTGRYRVHSDAVISVRRDGDRMLVKRTGQPETRVFPIAKQTLVVRGRNEKYIFAQDGEGPAHQVIFDLNGEAAPAPRIHGEYSAPFDVLEAGDIPGAVAAYRRLWAEEPRSPGLTESRLNVLGYTLLRVEKVDEAVAIFKLNVEFYPEAANTYDSLGEAYMTRGDTDLAIANYEKSLALNPRNDNAAEMLKRLRGR
jgi:CubicO group peptidase (beta-lactamase class C family)